MKRKIVIRANGDDEKTIVTIESWKKCLYDSVDFEKYINQITDGVVDALRQRHWSRNVSIK